MRRIILVMVACGLLFDLAAASKFNRIIYPIKTTDASGYVLVQDQAPQKIVSADPAVTEILFAFNLQDRLVGVTGNCDYPEEVKQVKKIGDNKVDKNKLVMLKPDLVIISLPDYSREEIESFRNIRFMTTVTFETWKGEISTEVREVSLEVFAVDARSLDDVMQTIDTIGTITNREHAAYSLMQRMKRKIEWVRARAMKEKRLKALVLTSKRPPIFAGEGTYLSDLAGAAGLMNVATKGKELFPRMNRKEIEKAGPDILIASTNIARKAKDVYNDRNFRKTSAGKNKKAVVVDKDLMLRTGPRLVNALEEIASSAYGWENKIEQTEQ